MIEVNFRGIDLEIAYHIEPADESVGLGERLYIRAIYYKDVDILEVVLAFDDKTDIRNLEEKLWDVIEKYER